MLPGNGMPRAQEVQRVSKENYHLIRKKGSTEFRTYQKVISWQYAAATVMLVAYPILSKFNICDNGADRDLTLKIHIEQDRGSYDLLLDHQDRKTPV